jgi:hypothetical protein
MEQLGQTAELTAGVVEEELPVMEGMEEMPQPLPVALVLVMEVTEEIKEILVRYQEALGQELTHRPLPETLELEEK